MHGLETGPTESQLQAHAENPRRHRPCRALGKRGTLVDRGWLGWHCAAGGEGGGGGVGGLSLGGNFGGAGDNGGDDAGDEPGRKLADGLVSVDPSRVKPGGDGCAGVGANAGVDGRVVHEH